jgi:hypothetical protein
MRPGNFPVSLFIEKNETKEKDDETGWVTKTLNKPAPQGKRNDTLCSLAGYLALTGVGPNVAIELLSLWNRQNNPPLPYAELETSVRSVFRTASKREKHAPSETITSSGVDNSLFDLMNFESYMSKYYGEEAKWLVDHWLPDQTIAFVVSPPGGHKTWLLLDLAVSVASGTPFLGMFPVRDKGPVIIIQQEDFHGQMVDRLSLIVHNRFGMVPGDENISMPPSLPIFIHPDRKLKFSDEKVMKALETQIEKLRPKLVIIDPLYSAADMGNYMADTASEMFALKGLRDKFGTGFVIAHHTKKGNDESGRERLWGSQFLNAFLETGWQIKTTSGDAIKLRRHFKQFADQKEVSLLFEIDTEEAYHYYVREEIAKPVSHKAKVKLDIDEPPEPPPPKTVGLPPSGRPEHVLNKIKLKNNREVVIPLENRLMDFLFKYKQDSFTVYELAKEFEVDVKTMRQALAWLHDNQNVTKDYHTYKWRNDYET